MTAPVIVFLGPTLALAEARAELDATYLGPVAQGDVLRAVEAGASAIAIIDGYFARVPAVWHKEILWALGHGVRVLGAASMGALRAAELAPFGMVGVGRIFAGFRAGELEDDDEVAISHGDADSGFRPLSDAMVDLRATFERAIAEQVIAEPLGDDLIARAKAMHYAQRSYAAVLADAERAGLPREPLARLRAWLPAHRVQHKRQDALELLRMLRRLVDAGELAPLEAGFRFEHTDAWEQLSRRSGHRRTTNRLDPRTTAPLLDELRLAARGTYGAALDGALARALARAEADRHELVVDDVLIGEAGRSFFLRQGTLSPEAIQAWMAGERLDAEGLTRLLAREARLHWARTLYAAEILAELPDQLRATGELGPLLARARAKQRLGDQLGDQLTVDPAQGAELLAWFFTERRGQPPPGNADACAQVLGFESGDRLLRALALERRFVDSAPHSDVVIEVRDGDDAGRTAR